MGNSSKLALALVGLVLGASLVACGDGRDGAEGAAQQLASAVSALDVGSVAFEGKDSGAANDQLKEIFQGLDPDKPAVQAGELTFESDTATFPAELHLESRRRGVEIHRFRAAEEVRRQVAHGVETGHAGSRAR